MNVFTPRVEAVGFYWLVLYILQVGFAVLTVVHRKVETRVGAFDTLSFAPSSLHPTNAIQPPLRTLSFLVSD